MLTRNTIASSINRLSFGGRNRRRGIFAGLFEKESDGLTEGGRDGEVTDYQCEMD